MRRNRDDVFNTQQKIANLLKRVRLRKYYRPNDNVDRQRCRYRVVVTVSVVVGYYHSSFLICHHHTHSKFSSKLADGGRVGGAAEGSAGGKPEELEQEQGQDRCNNRCKLGNR